MNLLFRRTLLAIAAVTDIALHARPMPVSAKALAGRHDLPPRHLEPILQALVRQGILKGLRGPRGGYELARERRRITAGDVARVIMAMADEEAGTPVPQSHLVCGVIEPAIQKGSDAFLRELDGVTIDDLCRQAELAGAVEQKIVSDFTI